MSKNEYHSYLRQVPLFANLDPDQLDAIGLVATDLAIEEGRVLIREGEHAHELFVVVEGTVEVTRHGQHVADIGPGGVAGEMALLANSRRNSTVTAKTPVRIMHLDGRSFSALLDEVPQLAVKLLPLVAARGEANSI